MSNEHNLDDPLQILHFIIRITFSILFIPPAYIMMKV